MNRIGTHDPSVRAGEDISCLRPRGRPLWSALNLSLQGKTVSIFTTKNRIYFFKIKFEFWTGAYITINFNNSPFIFWVVGGKIGVGGSVVCWGTMLQAGRLPVWVPDEVNFFFNLPNSFSRTMALGSTQPLTEMSTRDLPEGKKRSARRTDKLVAICESNVWKCGSLNLSQH
jgi:hypothetical protein